MTLEEASMNFDLEGVAPFLRRIIPLLDSGFGEEEIQRIVQTATRLQVDDEQMLEFPIRYDARATILRVVIFMDDVAAPDIAIFTHPALARAIQTAMIDYADEQGW
jgi:DNA helicase TIP49 (TBP-interacting protein)